MRKTAILLCILLVITSATGCNFMLTSSGNDSVSSEDIISEFTQISSIPRVSGGDLTAIADYLLKWAEEQGFQAVKDGAGNIIVEKKASEGRENEKTIILQSHMDMIPYADGNVEFIASTDGIVPIVKNAVIKSSGTNLGATSSLGMSNIMYVLKNSDDHPPLRAIFTVNGKTSMSGANNIESKYLDGETLINFNLDKANTACLESYYSNTLSTTTDFNWAAPTNKRAYVLAAAGFVGNKSGNADIESQPNPIRELSNILALAKSEGIMFELSSFQAGKDHRYVPGQATAVMVLNDYELKRFKLILKKYSSDFENQYKSIEPDATFSFIETKKPSSVLSSKDSNSLVSFLFNVFDSFSEEKENKNKYFSSIGKIDLSDGHFNATLYIQANTETKIKEITNDHIILAELSGVTLEEGNVVPGFLTDKDSAVVERINEINKDLYGSALEYEQICSTVELGLFKNKNPELQVLSLGFDIKGIETTHEVVSLDSVVYPARIILEYLK